MRRQAASRADLRPAPLSGGGKIDLLTFVCWGGDIRYSQERRSPGAEKRIRKRENGTLDSILYSVANIMGGGFEKLKKGTG